MGAKISYSDKPLGRPKVVSDFLPAPVDLVFREAGMKFKPKPRGRSSARAYQAAHRLSRRLSAVAD